MHNERLLTPAQAGTRGALLQSMLAIAADLGFDRISVALAIDSPGGPVAFDRFGNTPPAFAESAADPEAGRRDPVMRALKAPHRDEPLQGCESLRSQLKSAAAAGASVLDFTQNGPTHTPRITLPIVPPLIGSAGPGVAMAGRLQDIRMTVAAPLPLPSAAACTLRA